MADNVFILLVEDDERYALVMCAAFERVPVPNVVRVARDGLEAVAYLNGEGEFADRSKHPLPSLILLDLALPGMDGLEVVRWIRKQAQFRTLRVVMLTSSHNPRDSAAAYKLGVHSYLTKPTDLNEAVAMLARLLIPFVPIATKPELPPPPPSEETDTPS
jgi:CheY-like chemotaxis protein